MGLGALSWLIWSCIIWSTAEGGVIQDGDTPPCKTYTQDGRLHIDCSDLGLTNLPEGLDFQAKVVDLSYNSFTSVPEQLQYFIRMEELNLAGNQLTHLPAEYVEAWEDLHTFNLSNNNFEVWTNNGLGPNIQKLDLSKNKIYVVDEAAFDGMTSLHHLDLSENRIHELPSKIFDHASKLDNLVLSRNYFSTIPNFRSSSLRSVDLSSCQVSNLYPDSLSGMPSLLEIDLSINQIEYIPDDFASNTLQELRLSYNDISTLTSSTFSSLPHLAVLYLRGNDFKEVWSTSIFSSNPFLREIHVKGNRWSCEGFGVNLLLTYEYLTREPAKVGDKASLMCYSPTNVTQMSWQEAYIQTWHPEETYTTFTWVAVMVGIIIGVLFTSIICRGLMSVNSNPSPGIPPPSPLNINGSLGNHQTSVESVVVRIPLVDDLPPSYDEALLMPRVNSFHSLPDFVDEDEDDRFRGFRRSRSIGDLIEQRPVSNARRSIRPHRTVEISIE